MFFYGAPRHVPDHAARAVETILSLKDAMVQFNQRSHERNLPHLVMRAGISAGEMVVGDAGSKHRSDYTVLGDIANLGARLETANKFMGTQNLVNHRVIELAGDRFLYRPVGNILFKGKRIGVHTYEVLGLRESADAAQHRLAELSGRNRRCLHGRQRRGLSCGNRANGKRIRPRQVHDALPRVIRDPAQTRRARHV